MYYILFLCKKLSIIRCFYLAYIPNTHMINITHLTSNHKTLDCFLSHKTIRLINTIQCITSLILILCQTKPTHTIYNAHSTHVTHHCCLMFTSYPLIIMNICIILLTVPHPYLATIRHTYKIYITSYYTQHHKTIPPKIMNQFLYKILSISQHTYLTPICQTHTSHVTQYYPLVLKITSLLIMNIYKLMSTVPNLISNTFAINPRHLIYF